jgi:uncharacterized membrane protein
MSIEIKIEQLQKKIDYLNSKQADFQNYIVKLQKELDVLKAETNTKTTSVTTEVLGLVKPTARSKEFSKSLAKNKAFVQKETKAESSPFLDKIKKEIGFDWNVKSDIENFIGTNLISKIGILILIFGVMVGAKYAIDNDLISPLTRIVIGYVISFVLLAFSTKLKAKYENFSAVLLSGSLVMLYFLSFISYDFYGFIDQKVAFGLMFIFTAFSVFASIQYNKQLIALIGLVGSYAIPFLLSNNSGNLLFLFSYMAIINIGILVLSFKKDWKLLYYSAFIFTWVIFMAAYFDSGYLKEKFSTFFLFVTSFFVIFYITFLAYKLVKKEEFVKSDIVFIMLNSFIFYSLGFSLLDNHEIGQNYLGLFTVMNAVIHFIVAKIIFKQSDSDKKLFYLASIMVLIFITMAIPVQLNGSWITLFWALEAGLLFWIGRTKNISIYEKVSYVLIFLAFFSLLIDWGSSYYYSEIQPFFNTTFLTSIITAISFGFITKIFYDKNYKTAVEPVEVKNILYSGANFLYTSVKYIIPFLFIIVLFGAFAKEIIAYFDIIYYNSKIKAVDEYSYTVYNYDIQSFGALAVIFYSILFVSVASLLNTFYLKIKKIAPINLIANLLVLFIALSAGLMLCSELRESYLTVLEENDFYNKGIWHLAIRYINYAFVSLLVFSTYRLFKKFFDIKQMIQFFWLGFHVVILWILSSELLHWMDLNGFKNAYKISLTILWASYSLMAIALGIWKRHKFLRMGAIGLFGITLVKLFLYDLADLTTIHKVIVLISVGVLLLIASFLYNKYTGVIQEDNAEENSLK